MTHIFLLAFTSALVFSSDSFWNLWVGLELYSFFLTPWLIEGEGKTSKVYVFLYFMMQFLASVSFLVCSLSYLNKLCTVILFSSLLMKVSCFPFHSWFVNILPHVSWAKILVLTSLSKVVPLSMLTLCTPPPYYIWVLIMGLVLALGGYTSTCLRSLMAYSSVAHSSWVVICACLSKVVSALYMLSYLLVSLPLCFLFMKETATSLKFVLVSKMGPMSLVLLVLALTGIPPFLGFIPKLMVIFHLTTHGAVVEASALGILSIVPVYFYFKTGMLSIGASRFSGFVYSSPVSFTVVSIMGVSALALISFMLKLSLSMKTLICQIKDVKALMVARGRSPGRNWVESTTLKESKPFSEVMSPLAYGV